MLAAVAIVALMTAAVTAVMVARVRRDHLPFALFVGWIAFVTILRAFNTAWFIQIRPPGSPPFTGVARVAFHIDQAAELSSAAGLAVVAIVLCAKRRTLAVLPGLTWLAAVAYLATHYPEVRGDSLRRFYLAAELAALAVVIASIISLWWQRGGMTPARQCLFCCVAVDVGTLFVGAWRWGLWEQWSLNQVAYMMLYVVLTVYQGVIWSRLSRAS
jgi:hypothetical protein